MTASAPAPLAAVKTRFSSSASSRAMEQAWAPKTARATSAISVSCSSWSTGASDGPTAAASRPIRSATSRASSIRSPLSCAGGQRRGGGPTDATAGPGVPRSERTTTYPVSANRQTWPCLRVHDRGYPGRVGHGRDRTMGIEDTRDEVRKNIQSQDEDVEGHKIKLPKADDQDVEGHKMKLPKADDDDVEGHKRQRTKADGEDVEGHKRKHPKADDEDVEGHKMKLPKGDDDDVEGHKMKLPKADDDDVEGHKMKLPK